MLISIFKIDNKSNLIYLNFSFSLRLRFKFDKLNRRTIYKIEKIAIVKICIYIIKR